MSPMLQPKPKAGQKWLPNQVLVGMDTSDPDPQKWFPFGELVEAEKTKTEKPQKPSTNDS